MQRLQADHDADEFLLFSTRYDNLHGRHIELRDRAMGSTTMRRWFKACIEQAKLPDFPMHELRHTAGTQFHLAGGDIAATQKFMRHASPSTTRDHYVHLDTGHIIDGLKKAGQKWNHSVQQRAAKAHGYTGPEKEEAPSGIEPLYEALQASA